MTDVEILQELRKLSVAERLEIIEAALDLIRHDLQGIENPDQIATHDLGKAARALLSDYMADGELTAFTDLDGENFYA